MKILQVAASAHFSLVVWDWLRRNYPKRLISFGTAAAVPMSPQSPEFNIKKLYSLFALKSSVYAKVLDIRDRLSQDIQGAANEVAVILRVLKCIWTSFKHRADACVLVQRKQSIYCGVFNQKTLPYSTTSNFGHTETCAPLKFCPL
jgi:hypothetical protein